MFVTNLRVTNIFVIVMAQHNVQGRPDPCQADLRNHHPVRGHAPLAAASGPEDH